MLLLLLGHRLRCGVEAAAWRSTRRPIGWTAGPPSRERDDGVQNTNGRKKAEPPQPARDHARVRDVVVVVRRVPVDALGLVRAQVGRELHDAGRERGLEGDDDDLAEHDVARPPRLLELLRAPRSRENDETRRGLGGHQDVRREPDPRVHLRRWGHKNAQVTPLGRETGRSRGTPSARGAQVGVFRRAHGVLDEDGRDADRREHDGADVEEDVERLGELLGRLGRRVAVVVVHRKAALHRGDRQRGAEAQHAADGAAERGDHVERVVVEHGLVLGPREPVRAVDRLVLDETPGEIDRRRRAEDGEDARDALRRQRRMHRRAGRAAEGPAGWWDAAPHSARVHTLGASRSSYESAREAPLRRTFFARRRKGNGPGSRKLSNGAHFLSCTLEI
mmetsp:Transcript_22940/g.90969  ORF Transcript_22940/g.90969 Transcript_22940/m.90969 type:complete len:391 (+) Transcript_22940:57-1229(+)